MRKIVIACASFKGTLSSREAGVALARGLAGFDTKIVALADGGEGLVDALASQIPGAQLHDTPCRDPLGNSHTARFAMAFPPGHRAEAIIEMAASSGLPLVPESQRDPKIATTWGVGDQIRAAFERAPGSDGIDILLGLGGSATNDGGAGMAQALGAKLLDKHGRELPPGGAALKELDRIDMSGFHPRIAASKITVACDVVNPLCGPQGASAIYGPQKGATPADVEILDAALDHFAAVIRRDLGRDVKDVPGAGAAGGLGAGCMAFLNATLKPGIELVLDAIDFDRALAGASLVLTGEGYLDEQTLMGKACAGVAARAKQAGVPCVAIGGGIDPSRRGDLLAVFKAIESLSELAGSVDEAKRNGALWLEKLAHEKVAAWLL
ncbi:MAG: glycerate kinase [Planctomycetota bacterium]